MRKLFLFALVAAGFALPAFAQISAGGAAGGAMHSGANLPPPPVGNTASSAMQTTGNTANSAAQQAEDTAASVPQTASSSVNAGAARATQAQGVVSSDVKDVSGGQVSANPELGVNASSGASAGGTSLGASANTDTNAAANAGTSSSTTGSSAHKHHHHPASSSSGG